MQSLPKSLRSARLAFLIVPFCGLMFVLHRQLDVRLRRSAGVLSSIQEEDFLNESSSLPPTSQVHIHPWDISANLVAGPAPKFRDNLLPDKSYVTTFVDGGLTNEFMTYANLIYLASISERIAIIPPFAPRHHVGESAGLLSFGYIFDLPYFRSVTQLSVVEWRDVKAYNESARLGAVEDREDIGCWSTDTTHEPQPRLSHFLTDSLGLEPSYTAASRYLRRRLDSDGAWDATLLFWSVANLIFPTKEPRHQAQGTEFPSYNKGHTLPPDTHLACFDFLYYMAAGNADNEWAADYSPAWRTVGRHLRFIEPLKNIARGYLARALKLDLSNGDVIPAIITVHVRRGDFLTGGACSAAASAEECAAPLSAYARRVQEVQDELRQERDVHVPNEHVILTSDEESPEFWDEVASRGWTRINSKAERIMETHGEWFVILIDMIIQSMGAGFVGTDQSTVSIVARRRVSDWHHGVVRTVKWGKIGADDH